MKRRTHLIAAILALALLVTLIPAETIQAANAAPAKLSAKDFIAKKGNESNDFLTSSEFERSVYAFEYKRTATTGGTRTLKTNRGVKLGSTAAFVKAQYGSTAKVKVDNTDKIYKAVQYEYPEVDVSVWISYLEYTYKSGGNTYKLRFYLGKKNKVTAIFYIKNLKNILKYPNKEVDPGLTFQAPNGEKITTKTINGKKVYMVPRGTKLCVTKSLNTAAFIYRYSAEGKLTDETIPEYLTDGTAIVTPGNSYDLETVINTGMTLFGSYAEYRLNFDHLGKYLYFALYVDGEGSWNWETEQTNYTKSPKIYYFKFK